VNLKGWRETAVAKGGVWEWYQGCEESEINQKGWRETAVAKGGVWEWY
jgi:hypothetical protein